MRSVLEVTKMKRRLSKRLSPKAKKLCLQSGTDEPVSGLIRVSATVDEESLRTAIESRGMVVRSWLKEANLVTVDASVGQLSELAELDGVVYVEADERYGA